MRDEWSYHQEQTSATLLQTPPDDTEHMCTGFASLRVMIQARFAIH